MPIFRPFAQKLWRSMRNAKKTIGCNLTIFLSFNKKTIGCSITIFLFDETPGKIEIGHTKCVESLCFIP